MNEMGLADYAMQEIEQIIQLLQQGITPEQLLQQGVPQELIMQALQMLEEQAVAVGPQILPGQEGMSGSML